MTYQTEEIKSWVNGPFGDDHHAKVPVGVLRLLDRTINHLQHELDVSIVRAHKLQREVDAIDRTIIQIRRFRDYAAVAYNEKDTTEMMACEAQAMIINALDEVLAALETAKQAGVTVT